jgi:transposase
MIGVHKTRGKPPKIPITKKILVLLLKDIFQLSNRKMANFLAFFTVLTGIDISYKTVERIYSDELARMIVHNMFMIMIKKKGIKNADTSGDGTGYGLTVTKHYRNEREEELRSSKTNEINSKKSKNRRKDFVYAFGLMDLDTKMYIGYGSSLKSEKEAFHKAKEMAEGFGISINSVRLDKLYSHQSVTEEFGEETTIYIIPKKNGTIRGSPQWKRIIRSFIDNQISHLEEYYKRNNSESGYSVDKRLCGWKIWQKRPERIELALMCKGVWHNLMLLY